MKFYTLTYDANLPTTQQVNVPTNTDYKLGVKVRRNGEIQNLSPESVTLGTLSADSDKTNGYVTFTLSAGDNASYTQDTLSVDKGYDAEFYKPAYVEQNTTGAPLPVVLVSADLSDFVGKTIYPEDVYYSGVGNSRGEVSASELDENFGPYWRDNDWILAAALDFKPLITDKDGNAQVYMVVTKAVRDLYITNFGWPKDKPGFFVPGPNNTMAIAESYTVKEGDKIEFGKGYTVSNTRWYGAKLSITAGEPFDAKFKLNTNIFKSQQGDKADGVESANTAKLTGVYSDGTEFDYDIVIA